MILRVFASVADGALEALRGNARPAESAEVGIFWLSNVIAVEVGGRKVLDDVQFDEHFQLLLFQQVDRLLLTFASFAQIMRRGIRLPFGCGCIPRYVVIKFIHSEVV
jgi:hypothetical protein